MVGWADVEISNPTERLKLERNALFYIPSALERCSAQGLTVSSLAAFSSARNGQSEGPWAGRSAITKILGIKPVVHESAMGFIRVANELFRSRSIPPTFESADVVACVFRLKDPAEVVRGLGVTLEDVAQKCNLSREVVAAALQRYRLQYADAKAIWSYLFSLRVAAGDVAPEIDAVITSNQEDFIKTDVRSNLPLAVRRQDDEDYVYGWHNLRPAPRSGHPWALAPR